jgi:hypothetical protein
MFSRLPIQIVCRFEGDPPFELRIRPEVIIEGLKQGASKEFTYAYIRTCTCTR